MQHREHGSFSKADPMKVMDLSSFNERILYASNLKKKKLVIISQCHVYFIPEKIYDFLCTNKNVKK